MTPAIILEEVGPRDGLQNEPRILSATQRADLVQRLQEAGLRRIEIGSFVSPKLVPQMAHSDEVWRLVKKTPDVRLSVLTLSRGGLEQAIAAGISHVAMFVSASDTHSRKNVGKPLDEAVDSTRNMLARAKEAGVTVSLGISCAFGCFYEDSVSPKSVLTLIERLPLDDAVDFVLADTTGMGTPEGLRETLTSLTRIVPLPRLVLHLHDTYHRGYDNLKAGLDMGVTQFDTAIGGLGGCPFVPGAAGNISTEKTVELLERWGVSTNIDLEELKDTRRWLYELLGRTDL